MKDKGFLFIIISCLLLQGCLWPFHGAKSAPSSSAERPSAFVEVLNDYVFEKGGNILFIPFTAGPKAEAGPMADHVALLMVKGAADILAEGSSEGLKILTTDDVENADFILDGHIEALDQRVGMKVMGIGGRHGELKVEGQIRDRRTSEVVALISGYKIFRRDRDLDQAAYSMGSDIAKGLIGRGARP